MYIYNTSLNGLKYNKQELKNFNSPIIKQNKNFEFWRLTLFVPFTFSLFYEIQIQNVFPKIFKFAKK